MSDCSSTKDLPRNALRPLEKRLNGSILPERTSTMTRGQRRFHRLNLSLLQDSIDHLKASPFNHEEGLKHLQKCNTWSLEHSGSSTEAR